MGKGLEESIREELKELLGDDQEALSIALSLLERYVQEGSRGVRRRIAELLEAGNIESEATEA
ncbi:hypothetical protein MA03_06945 [Infirmifilum uzonense]|jgi:hypothetical protein|uniref:Uncharacterized protein n=2 Tax=Thermofilaceae TaxID=114378 RepID=A0A0F7FJ57_9CREN|nr:hypothetical protein MA03_06945 [Infirmifilum uzonense]